VGKVLAAVIYGARSLAAMLCVLLLFVLGGLYQRFVVWPLVLLFPKRRLTLAASYVRGMSRLIFLLLGLGGASARRSGVLPTDQPVLILGNHQGLLDIPTIILMSEPFVPLFVTRRRYARLVPAVSLALRLAGCPIIDPADRREALAVIRKTAREEPRGILIFPEGHRARDGEIGPFKAAGTIATLSERTRPVYLVVGDGFWTCCRLLDFLFNVHKIRGETEVLGPFQPPEATEELAAFVEHLRQVMIDHLKVMRERRGA